MKQFDLTVDALEAADINAARTTVEARIEAYRVRQPDANPTLIVDTKSEPAALVEHCIPELDAQDLTTELLRQNICKYGGLIVRNMFSSATMDTLIHAADQVIDACANPKAAPPPGTYFNPPANLRSIMPNTDKELGNTRTFHRDSGSTMCVEAPSVAEALLQLYEQRGLKKLMGEYLGEPPCLSVKKWVLRRSRLPVAEAGWHQDGAFMGTDINSINMWIPLNRCGGNTGAPGMDIVPRRLHEIVSADGAQFNWSVSANQVTGTFADNQPLQPEFNAGDAFFFDHFYLHRTQFSADFTRVRYAIETWFFGESTFPKNQIPLAW